MNSTAATRIHWRACWRALRSVAAVAVISLFAVRTAAGAAVSGTVITIAGNGFNSFSGDGGSATNAAISDVEGLAVGPDGTIYFTDAGSLRIRAIDPVTGFMRTVAGNGTAGNIGNGGPATNASLSGLTALATDRSRNMLYHSDFSANVVRRINLTDGIISIYAGTGILGFTGDGGAATVARLRRPWGIATDAAGKLSMAAQYRVRQVDPVSGIITTIAGSGSSEFSPDGFPAVSTSFHGITRLAADLAGNVFILEGFSEEPRFVRRVDVVSGLVSTVAGGGTNALGSGVATNMQFIDMFDIAASAAGELFIATNFKLFRVDLATGLIEPIAGDGTQGFSGDGGPASAAQFGGMTAVALVPGGGIVVADHLNYRIRYVAPDSIKLTNDSGQTSFTLPWVSSLIGDFVMADNPNLTNIVANSLTNVSSVVITNNTAVTVINLTSLATVSGELTLELNAGETSIELSSLTDVVGDLTLESGTVEISSLTNYGCGTNEVTMTLNAGTVEMTNGLTLCTNATLTGSTTIDGSITNNGTIEPGSSPGRLNITGNLHLNNASRLKLEIGGYASNEFDVVNVGNAVTLGGTISVSLHGNFKWVMTNGSSFTVVTSGTSLAGSFANVAFGALLTTTDGYARFTLLASGDNSMRLANLQIVDSDSDSMPDWWEDHFGLSKTNAVDAELDLDGDRASNAAEFAAGTDPTNPASVFRLISVLTESNGVRLTWSAVGGKSYRVQTNGTLSGAFADDVTVVTAVGAGEFITNVLSPNVITNVPARYYRLRLGP